MDKAIDIYKEQLKHGIDPMRRFVGPEYEVLIPLSGLDRFEYDPAYGKDYRDFGIYNKTFSVNPQTYSAACVMNRLGRELGVRLRVTDAWRPIKIQIEKFILNKAKDPSGDVFANPFGKEFEFSLSQDKKFRLRFSDGNGRLDIFAIDATNTAMTRKFADKITNDRFLSKYLRPTPHSVGGAMDILLLDGKGNPLTQPKWLAKKLFQDLEFIGWDFSKINDQFIHLIRDELNGAKGSEKDVVALLNKKLLEKIKPMINEQLKKKNPMATTHIECEEDAPPYLKESVLNIDYLTGIVDSIPNFIRTNDENWHFQCTNVREYGIITIDMAMRASEAHIARVKKECEDFARHAALGYNRKVKKGLEILLFKGVHFDDPTTLTRREFECSDLNFNKNNLVTFGEIKDKLSTIAARQKMLRQTGR